MQLSIFRGLAFLAALGVMPAEAQSGGAANRAPQTDQTVAAARGARLTVDSFAGEVVVRAWEKDAVRVQARHMARTRVSVQTSPGGVAVSASGTQGPAGSVDYEISVPAWMPVKVAGHYTAIVVDGTQSEVDVENVRGDISIRGGSGFVSARSVEGELSLEGPRGRISADTVNRGISIARASGEIAAETVNGPIRLTAMEAAAVDASTVDGNLSYEGTTAPRGRYRFATHNGNVAIAVPETSSAVFGVRSYNGSFNTNLPLQGGGDATRGRRVAYMLGSGSAEFELESFNGTIQVRRPGAPAPRGSAKPERD